MLAWSSPFLSIICYVYYKLIIFASQIEGNIVKYIKHIRKVGFRISQPHAIPRPLVRLNQWTILVSVILTWILGVFWILAIPLIANLLGVLCNFNPIIRVGRLFLKRRHLHIYQRMRSSKNLTSFSRSQLPL